MSKTIRINVAEPCHENWQQMTPTEQGRFCGSCQKIVVDFSTMTDKEILDYISGASHNICGRADADQMNRDIKAAAHKRRFSWAYVWNIIIAGFLFTKADAQVGKIKTKKPVVTKVPQPTVVGEIAMVPVDPIQAKGLVTNASDGSPVPGASIMIKGRDLGTSTDTAGQFKVAVEGAEELVVSCIGFETQTVPVEKFGNLQALRIALKPEARAMDTVAVVVVGYGTMKKSLMTGGIHYSVQVTHTEKAQRTITNWLPKKDIKVFPNPTRRGNPINLSLALKKPGEYRMELLDAAGKVVHAQKLAMPETSGTLQIPTNSSWSAGIYWLRITGKQTYQSKIVIR